MRTATVMADRLDQGEHVTTRTQATIAGAFLTCALALTGCAAESTPVVAEQPDSSSPSSPAASPSDTTTEPVTQEETCDWDSPRLESGSADAPVSATGDLPTAIIGSWQHTHINSGSGYEAVKPTTDIRYVFPSTTTMLYCQDVTGATDHAERQVNVTLDGAELILPSPATGYAVTAWDADTMVWTNHRDGSLYLLKRR